MTKSIKHEMRYDGASAEQVHAMLADEAFRKEVCDFQGFRPQEITITTKGAGMSVLVDQVQGATHVPSFAKKIVGDEINVVQSEDWDSAEHAALDVRIPGKPGEMKGSITLAEDDGGTTETVEITAKVKVPLVGGKLEDLITGLLVKALKAENTVGRKYLAR